MRASGNGSAPGGGPSVAIVGAGFGGIGLAIKLREAGYTDVTIYEKGPDLGGTWHWNTYPGAACDVPSHLYTYSFEPNPDWSRRFVDHAEIKQYLRRTAHKYGADRLIRFNTEVRSAEWREPDSRWRLELAGGEEVDADVLVAATGQLSRPATPRLPGIERFEGHAFHSGRWDHDYRLEGKRVAVVGTGASAIQFVPEIAPEVSAMHVFQRTAPYVMEKREVRYPKLVRRLFRRMPWLTKLPRLRIYLYFEFMNMALTRFPALLRAPRRWFRENMERGGVWEDAETRAALLPDYPMGCKRILISNDWYPTLRRPNVELVTSPIEEVRERSIVTADGTERAVDTIIYGTGFQTNEFLAPMRVTGRGGVDLNETWREGAEAYLGITVPHFPNMFILYGPNTNLGGNSIIFMLESQFAHVLTCLRLAERSGGDAVEVREEAMREFSEKIQRHMQRTVWAAGCDSWYRNEAGKVTNNWPDSTIGYRWRCRRAGSGAYRVIHAGEDSRTAPAPSPTAELA